MLIQRMVMDSNRLFFQGLPSEWIAILKMSGINIEDAKKNIHALKEVMDFNKKIQDEITLIPPMPDEMNLSLGNFIIYNDDYITFDGI
jgi:hypothetical protein